jgi:hypothetical protein
MHSKNTKDMKKLFEGWRGHNSAGLTEAEDPDSIPLAKGTGTRGRTPTAVVADPDAIPLGGSGAVSGDLNPARRRQAEKALKAAGVDTPLDRMQMFGEISSVNSTPLIDAADIVQGRLDPNKMTYKFWVETSEGLAMIEVKGGRARYFLPEEILEAPDRIRLMEPGELSGLLDGMKDDIFDSNSSGNRRILTGLDDLDRKSRAALEFATKTEWLESTDILRKGALAKLWESITKSYKNIISYFTLEARAGRADKWLSKLRLVLDAETTSWKKGIESVRPSGWTLDDEVKQYDKLIQDQVRDELASEGRYAKLNAEAQNTYITRQDLKIERLKTEANQLKGVNGLINGRHHHADVRPSGDVIRNGKVNLEALATPDPETGECDKWCKKAQDKLAKLQLRYNTISEEVKIREEFLDVVRDLKPPKPGMGRKGAEIVKRVLAAAADRLIRVFSWMAKKLAFFGHPLVMIAGGMAMAAGVYIVFEGWKKYTKYMEDAIGEGATRLLVFLAICVEEDPTGFLEMLINEFFWEEAKAASRTRPEERNVLEDAIARSMNDYYFERLERDMKWPFATPPERWEQRSYEDEGPRLSPGGDLLEAYIPGKSLKIILG